MLTHFNISQQGQSHIMRDVPCQDYSASKRIYVGRYKREFVIASVADGVGSCEYSQFGSVVAVTSAMNFIENHLKNKDLIELDDESLINLLRKSFEHALSSVEKNADDRELPFMEFDSTLTVVIFDGHDLYFGHIGDDGVVALYSDGTYEMITTRHKGDEAHSLFPLREIDMWQFGKCSKEVSSCVLMTDGVLDHCVDTEVMHNRVYFPFLEPALTEPVFTDEDSEKLKLAWDEYLSGKGGYPDNFRDIVTDDISFVVVQNPQLVKTMSHINFDFDKWDKDTDIRKKALDDALYADYRAYKDKLNQESVQTNDEIKVGNNSTFNDKHDEEEKLSSSDSRETKVVNHESDSIVSAVNGMVKDVLRVVKGIGRFVKKILFCKKRISKRNQIIPNNINGHKQNKEVVCKDCNSTSAN